MPTIVKPICAAALALTLGACSKLGTGPDEMAWARGALERNERVQVVASDPQARTFTVRMKDSGQLVVIPLDQIVAGPGAQAAAQSSGAPGEQQSAAQVGAQQSGGSEPAVQQATGGERPGQQSASTGQLPEQPAAPAPEPAPAPGEEAAAAPYTGGPALAAAGEPTTSAPGPHAEAAANARAGSVLASGPGYSIKAAGSKAGPARPSPATPAGGAPERLHDPIICQGARLLHIDNRNLEFDGDAITAEDGCEIHITNTHISAKGIGVLARGANVHIKNSEIDGDSGAVDASDGAQIYAQSSRFKGLTRRLESSAFHDLGGNVWN